jgi:DnaJ-class molecular chaperone
MVNKYTGLIYSAKSFNQYDKNKMYCHIDEIDNYDWFKLQPSKNEKSPWDVLGVRLNAPFDEVKAAFRKEILKHHPDHGGNPENARMIFSAWKTIQNKFVV